MIRWNRISTTNGSGTFSADLFHPSFPTLCAHLVARNVEFLVLGGWAAVAHGLNRTTLDVDIFVRPTRENVERLIAALSGVGFGTARELVPDDVLPRAVFIFKDQIRVDIFIRPWGLTDFDACWTRRVEREFESNRIPFVGLDDLIRSKETDRPQDKQDVIALRKIRDRRTTP